jgi:hypothetical protein
MEAEARVTDLEHHDEDELLADPDAEYQPGFFE